jgi:pimeloyl-ACP methyl ester carboxylesterase
MFDPAVAFMYGTVVEGAYRAFSAGVLSPVFPAAGIPVGWSLVTEMTAIDKIARKTETEFFGAILRHGTDGDVLVAIRGTDTLMEWLVDAEFASCAFPGAPGAGRVEDGFCGVYAALRCATGSDVLTFVRSLPPGTKVTIAGHSLGAAVATLLAVDLATNVAGLDLRLYTFASPRVGDAAFCAFGAARVSTHFRIVNRPDIVPRVPPLYESFGTEISLDSTGNPGIAHRIACYHTLTTYLWMLNQQSPFGLGDCARPAPAAASVSS